MEFNPANPIIQRCLQGMSLEESGKPVEAYEVFFQAWNDASNDFEKYIAAYYVARSQQDTAEKLQWVQTTLQLALKINNDSVKGALPGLYSKISECYNEIGDNDNAIKNQQLAQSFNDNPTDNGPFYHGTRADLQIGDLLTAGFNSNYKSQLVMNHIYFTALTNGAGLAAALAKGDGRERVYIVEATGKFENDPNVTDKKFPGNPSRSYRTEAPLKIVGEITEWQRTSAQEVEKWRQKLANNTGEIIN